MATSVLLRSLRRREVHTSSLAAYKSLTGSSKTSIVSSPLMQRLNLLARPFCSKPVGNDVIGVDLGTTNSCVSVMEGKKALAGLRRINLDGLRWRVFDAKDQVLGRLAAQISTVIQGKDKPTYAPNRDDGDMCIVINAKDISFSGRKLTDKVYYWHTGYVGHLKERTLKEQMVKNPTEVIRKAVMRMLPRNKLRDDRDRKLRIFAGNEHPFADRPVEPYVMPPRTVRELRPRARRAMLRAQKKIEEQGKPVPESRKGKKNKQVVEPDMISA